MQGLVEVTDLHVRYGDYEAVRGVSFSLGQGEILGIVGESGSGKSTIAKVLMGLEHASGGSVQVRGQRTEVGGWRSEVKGQKTKDSAVNLNLQPQPVSLQMIFQDAVGSLNPRMTVRQTLREIIEFTNNRIIETIGDPKEDGSLLSSRIRLFDYSIIRLLELVGLSPAVLDQYPREMSGGQCQRVSIARALACAPDVLVADEPVSALDVSVQARVLNLLRDLRRDLGLSILLIAHDLAVVKNVCDRICVMERGRFVDGGPAEEVFAHPTSDYTRRLLDAVPRV